MIFISKIFKNVSYKLKAKKLNRGRVNLQAGMTYVELIVVLSIFVVMSSVVLFDYGTFQSKVDMRNLANDIAIRIVEAQKSAISGIKTVKTIDRLSWKPSYGIYFNILGAFADKSSFIYFTDFDYDGFSDLNTACPDPKILTRECIDKILLTRGNTISGLNVFYIGNSNPSSLNDLSISFTRPDSSAIFKSTTSLSSSISYVQITVSSLDNISYNIKIYASGRVEIK